MNPGGYKQNYASSAVKFSDVVESVILSGVHNIKDANKLSRRRTSALITGPPIIGVRSGFLNSKTLFNKKVNSKNTLRLNQALTIHEDKKSYVSS